MVQWNGSSRATTVVSATQLTASIGEADVASTGTANVTVVNPSPGGGASGVFEFAVDSAASASGGVTVSAQTTTVSVADGGSTTVPVTVTGATTTPQVTLTCLNLPAGATCVYNSTSNTVTINISASTPKGTYEITMVFTVEQQTTAARAHSRTLLASWSGFLGLPLGLLWIGGGRRKKVLRGCLIAFLGLWLMLSLAACGGSPSKTTTTTTQSSATVMLTVN